MGTRPEKFDDKSLRYICVSISGINDHQSHPWLLVNHENTLSACMPRIISDIQSRLGRDCLLARKIQE